MSEKRVHPETGKILRRSVRPQTVIFGSLSSTLGVPGWYPDDDSDSVHSGADLKASDEAYQVLRKQYAAHVKGVRKGLGLTQEEAGLIIGGGKRAFQKYESGTTPPSDAAVGLIEILARHPEEVELLRSFRSTVEQRTAAGRRGRGAENRSKKGVRGRHSLAGC